MMGLVVRRNLSPGEMVAPSSDALPLFVIIDPTSLKVDADVNQSDLPKVQVGATAKFAVDGLPDKIYEGTVDEILPEADRQKNTVKVRLRLTNADQNLRMRMSGKVSLYGSGESKPESRRALFVPKEAVIEEGGQAHVFVAEGARAVRRTITIGERLADKFEVTDGLTPGETLIVKGQQTLTDGSPIATR